MAAEPNQRVDFYTKTPGKYTKAPGSHTKTPSSHTKTPGSHTKTPGDTDSHTHSNTRTDARANARTNAQADSHVDSRTGNRTKIAESRGLIADRRGSLNAAAEPQRRLLARRQGCMGAELSTPPAPSEDEYAPLSRTTDRVLLILLDGDLSRLRADSVAENLGISGTTLRRRLRNDHTSYQFLLDRARQYRCESQLRERWRPGKCMADELGYLEINSFYRAFKRWTGLSYSEYKQLYL